MRSLADAAKWQPWIGTHLSTAPSYKAWQSGKTTVFQRLKKLTTVIDILGFHETWQLTCLPPPISHSYPSLHLVQCMSASGHTHALRGSTREQSNGHHSCKKGLCSATRKHWCSSSLPKRLMLPYLSIFPSHSRHSSGPLLRLVTAPPQLIRGFNSLNTECTHWTPGFCQLMELNWLHTGSSTSVTEEAAVHDLKWVHPVGSIDILDYLNISQGLATSTWQAKNSWGVAGCILPLTPRPNTPGLLSGSQ